MPETNKKHLVGDAPTVAFDGTQNCPESNLPTEFLAGPEGEMTTIFPASDAVLSSMLEGMTFGEYVIKHELGRGAMGRVYKAWQPSKQRFVALKTIHPYLEHKRVHMNRLMREGFAQDKLQHSNIVRVYDFGEIEETPFIAFELIESGETLQEKLRNRKRPFSEQEAVSIILSLAGAVQYSHDNSVVHRDIKPSNIMMDGEVPKLTDFGLAFIEHNDVSRITRSGDVVGTISYMSPEQVRGSSKSKNNLPSPRWDIYALGATFYELLTGQLPFTADTSLELMTKILAEDPQPPRVYRAELSKEVEAVCIKCIEKSPVNRYQSAAALVEDLERFATQKTVQAPHIHWPLRKIRRYVTQCRLPILAFSAIVLAMVVAVRIVLMVNYSKRLDALQDTMGNAPPDRTDFSEPFLLKAIEHENLEVKMAAITALCRYKTPAAENRLHRAASDQETKIRFHLAQELSKTPTKNAVAICQRLLADQQELVLAAAVQLADIVDPSGFIPQLTELTMSEKKMVRTYAINSLLLRLGSENAEFTKHYFSSGPQDGRIELIDRFLRGRARPPISAMIDIIGTAESSKDKEIIAQCLSFFTGGDFGSDSKKWKEWWQGHRDQWHLRRCIAIIGMPQDSNLRLRDIIWKVDDQELESGFNFDVEESCKLTVFRDGRMIEMDGTLAKTIRRDFFIGTIDGSPVGNNDLIEKLIAVLD